MKISPPDCPQWLAKRKATWRLLDDNMRYEDTKEMNETLAAQKKWFIEGDLQPLIGNPASIKKKNALSLSSVLYFCPCTDIDKFTQFMKDYCDWLSEQQLDYWGQWYEKRDEKFINDMLGFFSGDNAESSAQLKEHFLRLLLPGDDGKVTFPFAIGKDNWQPSANVSISMKLRILLLRLGRFLFDEKADSDNYAHLKESVSFIKRNFYKVDPIIFSTDLLEERYQKEDGEQINAAGQKLMRGFLGCLTGYEDEPIP